MRMIKTCISAGLVLALGACGTKKAAQNSDAPAPAPTASNDKTAAAAALPQATIVRVAVDDKGNVIGAPEMRTTNDTAALSSGQGLSQAFTAGQEPKIVASTDELDKNSSTQSWGGWNYYSPSYYGHNNYYNTYGYGYYGCGSYCGSYGSTYWYSYRPVVYSCGSQYGYGYNSYYNYGGYNYYGYSRGW